MRLQSENLAGSTNGNVLSLQYSRHPSDPHEVVSAQAEETTALFLVVLLRLRPWNAIQHPCTLPALDELVLRPDGEDRTKHLPYTYLSRGMTHTIQVLRSLLLL